VEYVESKKDPLIQNVRTHQHNTNSTILQMAIKFKKSFKSETKQIKNMIAQNIKENGKKKDARTISMLDEKLVDK
jgi:hypothetical protein